MATQMRFFMDTLIIAKGYLLNRIFSYQVHNILTQGWSTLHGSWQTDWRGRPDTYDFITLYWTMLLYICHHFFFFIPVLYLHASIWGLPVLILYCIPANSYNCGIIVMKSNKEGGKTFAYNFGNLSLYAVLLTLRLVEIFYLMLSIKFMLYLLLLHVNYRHVYLIHHTGHLSLSFTHNRTNCKCPMLDPTIDTRQKTN